MRNAVQLLTAFACASAGLFGAPSIGGIVNAASFAQTWAPNGAIAQGAIFTVFGTGLGPAALVQAPLPLPNTLGGTSITVTVNGTQVDAPMYFSLETQLSAILPSNTPVGTGTLRVTFGGSVANFPITVVQSNVAIFTSNLSGGGPGVVTFANTPTVVTYANSTKAGDILTLWATGLGPITTSDANSPPPVDLGTPIRIYMGGVQATLLYRGRSGFAGLDQINFIVPPGVPPGCSVSLVIQTNNLVSNGTTIPVAPGGGPCSNGYGVSPSELSSLLLNKSVLKAGLFNYAQHVPNQRDVNPQTTVSASANLFSVSQADFPAFTGFIFSSTVSPGSCVTTVVYAEYDPLDRFANPLNAGASLKLQQPSGAPLDMASSQAGKRYAAQPGSYQAGTQTVSGTGGPDLGAFSVNFTVPPLVTLTNRPTLMSPSPPGYPLNSGALIDRTQPLTFTWTGGDPNGFVNVVFTQGYSVNNVRQYGVEVICAAPLGPGTFTVPPSALLSLPPAPAGPGEAIGGTGISAAIHFESIPARQILTVTGLDLAIAEPRNTISTGVYLQ